MTASTTASKPATTRGKAPTAPVEPEETEQQIKNRLRNEAERDVLSNHKDEYHAIAEAKFKAAGFVFNRRKTEQEKAADKVAELMKQFPELRDQFATTINVVPVDAPAVDPEWEARKQAVADVAAADGVHMVEGHYPEPDQDEDSAPGWPSDEL